MIAIGSGHRTSFEVAMRKEQTTIQFGKTGLVNSHLAFFQGADRLSAQSVRSWGFEGSKCQGAGVQGGGHRPSYVRPGGAETGANRVFCNERSVTRRRGEGEGGDG